MRFNRTLTIALAAAVLAAAPAQAATLRWAAQNDVISLDPVKTAAAVFAAAMARLAPSA